MLILALKTTKLVSCKTSDSFHDVDYCLMTTHVHGYAPLNRQVVLHFDFNLYKQHNI